MQPPAHHVAMMQIDCEVMNTRLMYIKEDAIPVHMTAQMRSSSAGNSSLQRNESHANETGNGSHHDQSFEAFAEENEIYDGLPQAETTALRNEIGSGVGSRFRRKSHAALPKMSRKGGGYRTAASYEKRPYGNK